jgi:hypothetical protein
MGLAIMTAFAVGCTDSGYIGALCSGDCGVAPTEAGTMVTDACANAGCADADGAPACPAEPIALRLQSDALYMVFDDTGSLVAEWPLIVTAFKAFLEDDASQRLKLGLALFGSACDAGHYTPQVPVAPLPANAASLRVALPSAAVQNSSTLPALKGAMAQARIWAAANVDTRLSLVLVTDALPAECDASAIDYTAELSKVLSEGLEGTPSVPTFVVGFGSHMAIRSLGAGTTSPAMLAVNEPTSGVLAALRSVRDAARSCAVSLPTGVRPVSLAWTVRVDGQRELQLLGQASDCDDQDGFYVARAGSPAVIAACPRTCASLGPENELSLSANCTRR